MVKELGAGEDAEAGAMRMNRGAGRHMESKLPQVPQRWPQRLLRSLAAALLLAFLGVAAWPISPWRSGEKYVVAITALGEKSPDAASSEVWIAGAPDGVDLGALAASSTTPLGWEQRGQTLVSYRDQPATISFHGVLKPEDQFLFGRHHWSGRVRVEINGQSRDYDLHSPEPTTPLAVALSDFPAGKAAKTRPNPVFLLWLAVWTVALAALLLAGPKLLRRLPPGRPSEAPGLDGIRFALPSLIVFGFVLAGTWPAQMSPDSVFQWDQLHTGNLNNWAPVIHTVLVGGLGALLGSIGWSMILQIVALAAAIGFLCRELSRWSINRALAWTAAVVTPLSPAVALLSTVFWKDIPFSIALCVLTALVLALVRTDGAVAERRSYMAGLAVTLFLAAAFRHNGVIVTLGAALLVGIAYRRVLRSRGILLLLSAGVVLPFVWSTVLLPAAGIPGARQLAAMTPMHILAAMAAEGQPLDGATTTKMEGILPLSEWKSRYDCFSANPLSGAPNIHFDRLDASLAGPALRAALAHPSTVLRHLICLNSLNWRLSPVFSELFPIGIYKVPDDPRPWDMTMQANENVRAILDRVFQWTVAAPWRFAIFWRPATTMLALLVFVAMAALQGIRPILLLPLAPVFLNVASLVPLMTTQDFRYEYPAVLIGPLLIAFYAGVCSLSTTGAQSTKPLDASKV